MANIGAVRSERRETEVSNIASATARLKPFGSVGHR